MAGRSDALYLDSLLPNVTVPPWTIIISLISSIKASSEESDELLLQDCNDRANAMMYNACFIVHLVDEDKKLYLTL